MKKNKLVGKECPCGVSFQHIHLEDEGFLNPISVVEAIDRGLLKQNTEDWEMDFESLYDSSYDREGEREPFEFERLRDFIRNLINKTKMEMLLDMRAGDESWEKEIRLEIIKKIKKLITNEINLANEHGQETARLTALYNKIINKFE